MQSRRKKITLVDLNCAVETSLLYFRVSYALPSCLIVPLTIAIFTYGCGFPSPGLAPLLKCVETWTVKSVVLVIAGVVWSFTQLLVLMHSSTNDPAAQ